MSGPGLLARRPVLRLLARSTSMMGLLTAAYYVWPGRSPTADTTSLGRTGAAVLSLGLVAVVVRSQIRSHRRRPGPLANVEALLTTLYFLVVVFAAVYYLIARTPGEFNGLSTRTDALYFTVTVLATVGFGDITAVSTFTRVLVTVQMMFGLVYIGTAVRLLSNAALPAPPQDPASSGPPDH